MLARDEFLEYAKVFDNYYGTAKSVLEQAFRRGNDVLLDIDIPGDAIAIAGVPAPPKGTKIDRVDVVVRVKRS